MPKAAQSGDFFVVGGPLQPDRACYVRRAADEHLPRTIAAQRFAYVFGPRASGKSSLMARTIRRLRGEGQLAAVVDLTQIGARGETVESGRWYYSIAYRIVRELRLKVDLQAWWQDKSVLLNEQRLVEFFWDIVLTNTEAPVTIFFDEAERAADLPFSDELFIALRSCYMRRVSEPDFARLNFVVLGCTTPEALCADASVSPFTDGVAIELEDFTREEVHQLAPGFGQAGETARALLDAIYTWTRGQPYLTQKVARGVARRGGQLAHVEHVVRELLLAPGASQEEPLLNHIRSLLGASTPVARQGLALLARIGGGLEVTRERKSQARVFLTLAGLVRTGEDGVLRYRNPVFQQIFDERFARGALPVTVSWRRPLTIAAALAVAVLVPYWYTQVLPAPYIDTLNVVSQDYELAREAYTRLRRIPGFAATADRLLAEAMVRRSAQASTMSEVLAADRVLRSLPERESLADATLAGYWLRQSRAAMHRGDRDAALLYAVAAREGRPEEARAAAAELIGRDYRELERSFRLAIEPIAWTVDWERDQIVAVDQTHRVHHLALRAAADGGPGELAVRRVPGRLTAVQHVAVRRELNVDAEGTAGAFNLLLTTQHARASDLMLRLRAPSGAYVELGVPQPRADQQLLIFSARRGSALASLSAEPIAGQWELSIVDRRMGEAGVLTQWGLQFAGSGRTWEDRPEQGIPLPDPTRTEQVAIELADDGRTALAVPTRTGASGAISVWDLAAGERTNDLEIQGRPEHVRLLARTHRVVVAAEDSVTLWDLAGDEPLARIAAETRFVLPPAVSPGERFIALAEADGESSARITLVDAEDGSRLATVVRGARLEGWALGSDAAYLAVLDSARRGHVVDPRTGEQLAEFVHQRPLAELLSGPRDVVVAIDIDGALVSWPLERTDDGITVRDSVYLGRTADPDSVSLAAGSVSFVTPEGLIAVRGVEGAAAPSDMVLAGGQRDTRLSPSSRYLVSASDSLFRLWRLDGSVAAQPLDLSAVALDRGAAMAALGFRGGHVRVQPLGGDARPTFGNSVDYIGHRGPVTSLTVNSARGVLASGGADGVVRLWDLATVAPNEYFMRHPAGPIRVLAMSADARWLASGAEYSARVWRPETGELANEIPVDGQALALAFDPRGDIVAVGDSAGNIFLGAPAGAESLRAVRARSAVTAIAFSADATVMASGDREGNLVLWDVLTAEPIEGSHRFSDVVTWIAFGDDGATIYVKSGPWVHALERGVGELVVSATRLLPAELGGDAVIARAADGGLRVLGGAGVGRFMVHDLTLARPATPPLPAGSTQLERDWPRILGLELDPQTGSVRMARTAGL